MCGEHPAQAIEGRDRQPADLRLETTRLLGERRRLGGQHVQAFIDDPSELEARLGVRVDARGQREQLVLVGLQSSREGIQPGAIGIARGADGGLDLSRDRFVEGVAEGAFPLFDVIEGHEGDRGTRARLRGEGQARASREHGGQEPEEEGRSG